MAYDDLARSAAVHFFIRYKDKQFAYRRMFFAYRRMFMVPRVGDLCIFDEVRYRVWVVEWCLDLDATEVGLRVNIELVPNGSGEPGRDS